MRVYLGNLSNSQLLNVPYSCGTLRVYAEANPIIKENVIWEPFLYHTLDGVQALADMIIDPDVLGLSCYVWNTARSKKLAKIVKERYPNCLIVFGGPAIPNHTLGFIKSSFNEADILVNSEGEVSFEQILLNKINGIEDWDSVPGIWYKKNNAFVWTHQVETPKVENMESPYLKGYFDDIITELNSWNKPIVVTMETNRGCPYRCSFCVFGSSRDAIIHRKIRRFNIDKIFDEISFIMRIADEVHVTDTNFGILPRDVDIMRHFVDSKDRVTAIQLTYAKEYNERIITISEMMNTDDFDIKGVTMDLQTATDTVLQIIQRHNVDRVRFVDTLKKLHENDVRTYTNLIIGLPGETLETFKESVEFVLENDPDNMNFYMLGFSGDRNVGSTETREKYKIETVMNKVLDGVEDDEDEYTETILSTKDISSEEMQWLMKWRDIVLMFHFDRFLYYVAWYLKREHDERMVDFYGKLYNHFKGDKGTVIGKYTNNWYLRNYNRQSFSTYKGPYKPHGFGWEQETYFNKYAYNWMILSELRDDLYSEIEIFLKKNYMWTPVMNDLFKFQRDQIIEFSYDPNVGKRATYNYNWFGYFYEANPLEEMHCDVVYNTQHISRKRIQLKPNDPHVFSYVAGCYNEYNLAGQMRQNTFIHRAAIINNQITYEPSFGRSAPTRK